MNKKSSRLSPLQILVIAAILAAVAIYRLMGPSPDNGQTSTLPTAQAAAPRVEIHTEQVSTGLPPQQTGRPTPTAKNTPSSKPAAAMKAFDYFVLSLSWSPDFCASTGNQDVQQCSIGKKLGFVLHGLWPQNKQGYPSNCAGDSLSNAVKAQFPGLYPAASLYDHEWDKHGTCTGLPPQQYLSLTKQMKESVIIPADFKSPPQAFRISADNLKQEFTAANPDLTAGSLAVNCSGSGRFLSELFVCFARDGSPTACSSEVQKNAAKSCQNSDFLVRNTR